MAANMMYTAISGLNTFNDALSVVSDNIANANTTAFKSQTLDFGDLVSGYMPTVYSDNTAEGVGATILDKTSDQSTGAEMQTNVWSNLMIQGGGYFKLQNTTTAADYYTRDGAFQVNSAGYLTDMDNNEVLDTAGSAINLNPPTGKTYSSYSVDQYGSVYGVETNGTQVSIDQIGITTFSDPSGLVSVGNNLVTTGPNSGTATVQAAGAGQAGTVISGALEGSNVDLTTQMVNMINYQADYQANSKSIVTGDTLLQTVVGLIAG